MADDAANITEQDTKKLNPFIIALAVLLPSFLALAATGLHRGSA